MTSDKKNKFLEFPNGFLWGTATSGHQVEGNNVNSDWWSWEQMNKGKVLDVKEEKFQGKEFEPSGKACDHYNKYNEDFALISKLNNNAYRMSIEWARIEPKPGDFDYNEIKHYHDVLSDLKKRGIQVMLTLNHFTVPQWMAMKGGWTNWLSAKFFERWPSDNSAFARCISSYRSRS